MRLDVVGRLGSVARLVAPCAAALLVFSTGTYAAASPRTGNPGGCTPLQKVSVEYSRPDGTASSTPSALSTEIDQWMSADGGVRAITKLPPPNWRAGTATDAELSLLGLPPRPRSGPALAAWMNTYGEDRPGDGPAPCVGGPLHGPVVTYGSNSTQGTYLGFQTRNAYSWYGAQGGLTAPWVTQPCPVPMSGATGSAWVGTTNAQGTATEGNIDQAGIDFDDLYFDGGNYKFFVESYPAPPVYYGHEYLNIRPGDSLHITESWSSSNGGDIDATLSDQSNHTTWFLGISGAGNRAGTYSEWITERLPPSTNAPTNDMPDFHTIYWWDANALTQTGTAYSLDSMQYGKYLTHFGTSSDPDTSDMFSQTWASCT